jgi:hypothetical protein
MTLARRVLASFTVSPSRVTADAFADRFRKPQPVVQR